MNGGPIVIGRGRVAQIASFIGVAALIVGVIGVVWQGAITIYVGAAFVAGDPRHRGVGDPHAAGVRRLHHRAADAPQHRRGLRHDACLVGITVVVYLLLQRATLTLDMTVANRFTLSPETDTVLHHVTLPMRITGFYSPRALSTRASRRRVLPALHNRHRRLDRPRVHRSRRAARNGAALRRQRRRDGLPLLRQCRRLDRLELAGARAAQRQSGTRHDRGDLARVDRRDDDSLFRHRLGRARPEGHHAGRHLRHSRWRSRERIGRLSARRQRDGEQRRGYSRRCRRRRLHPPHPRPDRRRNRRDRPLPQERRVAAADARRAVQRRSVHEAGRRVQPISVGQLRHSGARRRRRRSGDERADRARRDERFRLPADRTSARGSTRTATRPCSASPARST